MKKIEWCCNAKNGIELVAPNVNLANAYLLKAESSLETAALAKSKDWKVSASYYSMYFSLYAVLQRIGVKCEIHACTITFAKEFLKEFFSKDEFSLLDEAFDARQDMQYYVDRSVSDKIYLRILARTPSFMSHCSEIKDKLNEATIRKIRTELSKYLK